MHCFDALLVMVSAAISKVIPVDHGDDGVSEVHRFDCVGQICGFFRVQRGWGFDGANSTESAASRAFLTCNHERSITTCPTIVDVWASCFLADSVKGVVFHRCFCCVEDRLLFA